MCVAFGKKTGAEVCNPGKPGYTMACSPYVLRWALQGLSFRSLKPLQPWFNLKHCWLKVTVGETPTLCEGVTAQADVVINSFLLCFKCRKYEEVQGCKPVCG